MNGRTYNVVLGRFMQADPHIQAPINSQNYNRYSYVLNNPMSYTDPSGYFFKKLGKFIKKHWRTIASIAIAVYLPGASFMSGFGPVTSGAITGFVAGGVATGSLKGALIGAFTGAMFGGIHNGFAGKAMTMGMKASKTLLHGMAGGISSVLSGGKFGHGFVAAGFTQAVSQGGDVFVDGDRLGNAIKAAAIGGTASTLTGGKFANGAVTGAFSRLLNDEAKRGYWNENTNTYEVPVGDMVPFRNSDGSIKYNTDGDIVFMMAESQAQVAAMGKKNAQMASCSAYIECVNGALEESVNTTTSASKPKIRLKADQTLADKPSTNLQMNGYAILRSNGLAAGLSVAQLMTTHLQCASTPEVIVACGG
tara:strand:- start:1248 stop:2339 length:1092 start_codon:yes stop_codon:yes gene_type:complete